MNQRKTKPVTVKFSHEDYEKVQRRAKRSNCKVSTYIRDAAIAGTQRKEVTASTRIQSVVSIQDTLNDLNWHVQQMTGKSGEELKNLVNKIDTEVRDLWAYL